MSTYTENSLFEYIEKMWPVWVVVLVVIVVVVIAGITLYNRYYKSDTKKDQDTYRAKIIREKFNSMNRQIKTLKSENARVNEKFTKLASCPGVKERYCTCKGPDCSCGNGEHNDVSTETYKNMGSIPVRHQQNMVAGAIGKAKKLKAEAALRGAAPGLPMPVGGMLGKEPILSLDGMIEAFMPNKGRY